MAAIFEMNIGSETLTQDELSDITGCARKSDQVNWLNQNQWVYHLNKSGDPIVGRMFARLKLSGISPNSIATTGGWVPDFKSIQ